MILGVIKNEKSELRETTFSSKAYGTRKNYEIKITGNVTFDAYTVTKMDKLSSYTLNYVASVYLGTTKEVVEYKSIGKLSETPEGNAILCSYCLTDAKLPLKIIEKKQLLTQYIEMARVCGVPMNSLMKGQQIKVLSKILDACKSQPYILPYIKPKYESGKTDDVGYEGAVVIVPKKGYYKDPIATLDFSSLYPSIIQAHNLCYSTLLSEKDLDKFKPEDYTKTPAGYYFVKSHIRKGILPQILEDLLGARKKAKKEMAEEEEKANQCKQKGDMDGFNTHMSYRSIQNARQLALKVSANSVYGFTGALVGKLPCIPIGSSVTAFGREMIELTKNTVEEKMNCVVIYGDTDSVMVNFGVDTVEESMKLGKEAVKKVNNLFKKPIHLEFEKVYFPYLLLNKKRYAGLFWTRPEEPDKLDSKGIETARRDNSKLLRESMEKILNLLLREKDVKGAIDYAKSIIMKLHQGDIDISKLIISKGYTKEPEEYLNPQPHINVNEKNRKEGYQPVKHIGDRIPYVIVKSLEKKVFQKAEDPIKALEQRLNIDHGWYIENQFKKPFRRIFGPILAPGKTKEEMDKKVDETIFCGEHTRKKYSSTPSTTAGGIMKWVKVTSRCIICKASKKDEKNPFCKHCFENEDKGMLRKVLLQKVDEVEQCEEKRNKLWSQCVKCQRKENESQLITCSNMECEIFFERTTENIKLKRKREELGNLEIMKDLLD